MPTVPEDPFGPWLPWQATNHIVERCDASSGHAVAPIAFCDNTGRAAFIARACNAHKELYAALKWFIDDIDGTHTVMVDFDRNVERARKALAQAETQS